MTGNERVAPTAFAALLAAVDCPAPGSVRFTGADPVLPTRFPVGAAGAAALAAVGSAVSAINTLRGRAALDVGIDLAHAGAALRSSTYLRIDGNPLPNPWDPIAGFYPTRDGRHIQLHTNFPHHRDGTVKLLGARNERSAVAAAILRHEALPLEDAMAAAGLCATMVRTREEWLQHPQRRAIAGLPVVQVHKVADGPAQPFAAAGARPLAGVRVLDLTRVLAGPTCGRTLAEHGAQVLAIASPRLPNLPALVLDTNHGKFSAHLHLDDASDRAMLQQLVRGADVFSQGYRPGALAGRGFSVAELTAMRPGIVVVDLCAYGDVGPWAARRGYDTLVQSASGIALEQGGGEVPRHLPCSALDYIAGYLGAYGALVALARRARDGGSYHVQVSLAQTARWLDDLGRIEGPMPPPDLAPDITALLREGDSPAGRLRFLGPVLTLSGSPPGWDFAAVPTGTHAPAWQ